jgi:hypothetical protein
MTRESLMLVRARPFSAANPESELNVQGQVRPPDATCKGVHVGALPTKFPVRLEAKEVRSVKKTERSC